MYLEVFHELRRLGERIHSVLADADALIAAADETLTDIAFEPYCLENNATFDAGGKEWRLYAVAVRGEDGWRGELRVGAADNGKTVDTALRDAPAEVRVASWPHLERFLWRVCRDFEARAGELYDHRPLIPAAV